MSIITSTIKNLRTIVAESSALKNKGKKDHVVVASWITNGQLDWIGFQLHNGSREQAEQAIEAVTPILKEADKIGWSMDGLPASTVFQARALRCVAKTIKNQAVRRLEKKH